MLDFCEYAMRYIAITIYIKLVIKFYQMLFFLLVNLRQKTNDRTIRLPLDHLRRITGLQSYDNTMEDCC